MSLGYPQRIALSQFKDCLEKTKKSGRFNDSATLISGLLGNSSIVQYDSDRSFSLACTAIDALNKFLCPGVWCNRSHCKDYNSSSAYNCWKTRPAVCGAYAEYRKKQIKKKVGGKFYENEEAKKQISWLFDDAVDLFDKSKKYRFQNIVKENICAGIYYDESAKKHISFYWDEDRFLISENKKEVDAIEVLFSKQKYAERELTQRIYSQVKEGKL
jgi:hypothetical protein